MAANVQPRTTAGSPQAAKPSTDSKQPAKPVESKEERFLRLASRRTNRAIKDLRAIAPLCNKAQYSYTDAQVAKMLETIKDELDAVRSAFAGKAKAKDVFMF